MSRFLTRFLKTVPRVIQSNNLAFPTLNAVQRFSTGQKLFTPKVCQPAPFFKGTAVIGGQFQDISLDNFKDKYLVLVFYPLDFTFVCPTELIAYDAEYDNFKKINTEIIGISVDSHFSHLAWTNLPRNQGGLGSIKYPLLSDFNKTMSEDYGVLLRNEGVALRGLFIIDPKGIIRHISINDLPIGRSVKETLRLVEAIQFVEQHGEVCPANWNKGEKTIKPDPKGSKEYFQTIS